MNEISNIEPLQEVVTTFQQRSDYSIFEPCLSNVPSAAEIIKLHIAKLQRELPAFPTVLKYAQISLILLLFFIEINIIMLYLGYQLVVSLFTTLLFALAIQHLIYRHGKWTYETFTLSFSVLLQHNNIRSYIRGLNEYSIYYGFFFKYNISHEHVAMPVFSTSCRTSTHDGFSNLSCSNL